MCVSQKWLVWPFVENNVSAVNIYLWREINLIPEILMMSPFFSSEKESEIYGWGDLLHHKTKEGDNVYKYIQVLSENQFYWQL